MSNYLVTGSIGFVGTQVCMQLLESGHRVTGIDSINDSYDPTIKHVRLSQLENYKDFKFHSLDILNSNALNIFTNTRFEGIIHLAARAGVRQSLLDPHGYLNTNLMGTLNLLELCRSTKTDKFVFASTSSLYGETHSNLITESYPTDSPLTPYSVSKKSAELLCYSYHHQYNIDISINRYFTVYGQFGRPDMSIFKFIKLINEGGTLTVFGDGSQTRDFTHVNDVATGTIKSLKKVGYQIFNLGSNNPVSVNQVIDLIENKLGKTTQKTYIPRNSADVTSTYADITKAHKILNWMPRVSFEDGIQMTIDWYMTNTDWLDTITIDS
ncbi:MAG: nucleotide sugar epimerase [Legionellales bacterium]|nr:nucleotide sugar epimerase [Legionellales bacterium]